MEFSVIIPLGDHRHCAVDCVRAWVSTQSLPPDDFELICMLPAGDPDNLHGPIKTLLRPSDRLILSDETHDMSLCAEGAAQARGRYLFFTESHVWPEQDVLGAAKAAFERHRDWAGFSCRTERVATNRVARLEADLYERDIDRAMGSHPWKKLLDQCFVTRRKAYVETGGFEPELGHYAEWTLAARYFDRGLKIGYAPDIKLRHLYSGNIAELHTFIESFVKGEMRFFARGHDADSVIWSEAPPEWSQRGDWDRSLARALATCLRSFGQARPTSVVSSGLWREMLYWSGVAAGGAKCSILLADLRVALRRVLLSAAAIAGSRSRLMRWYEELVSAIIHARRLREVASWLPASNNVPCPLGDATADNVGRGRRMAGFHLLESFNSIPMRWSAPAAIIELAVPFKCVGIGIHCAPVRPPLSRLRPMFFVNEVPVPASHIELSDYCAVISLDRTPSSILRLAWICQPLNEPRNGRRLGLPIFKISVNEPPK